MNIKVDFDNIVVKEDKNDFNVKVLMLKGEKGEAGATNWGAITGTLSNQTDLKNALDGKANQTDFNTVSGQVNTNTSNISTINGQITDINGELDDFEDLFYGNATVNDENTSITLENTVEAGFKSFDLKGNTSQTGTPTPSSPIPVNVVSGDNEVQVWGKNILNTLYQHNAGDVVTSNGITFTFNQDGSIKLSGTATSNAYVMLYGELNQFSTTLFKLPSTFKASGGITYPISILGRVTGSGTYQELRIATGGTEYGCVFLQVVNGQSVNTTIYPQIEKGSQETNYEPYQGNTYNIDLPSGMELCKIGTYQDYIYKDSDKWYLYKAIGKVVFDGTYTFFKSSTSSIDRFGISFDNIGIGSLANSLSLSSHLVYKASANANPQTFYISTSNSTMYIDFSTHGQTTLSDFTTWLSANTPAFYLILATPTTTQITDTTLISQLNVLEQATSKNGETNISQVNDDLPFIIYAEAFANTFNGRMEGMDYKIDKCEVLDNKITSITSGSTDSEYPSAKAVYDLFNSITDGDEVSY